MQIPNGLTQAEVDANIEAAATLQVQMIARQQLNDLMPQIINALLSSSPVQSSPQTSKGMSSTQSVDPIAQWQDLYAQAGFQ